MDKTFISRLDETHQAAVLLTQPMDPMAKKVILGLCDTGHDLLNSLDKEQKEVGRLKRQLLFTEIFALIIILGLISALILVL
jgi:hypothetical protein